VWFITWFPSCQVVAASLAHRGGLSAQRCNAAVVAKPALVCQSSVFFRHLN
jgi:hypothetical protein